MNYKGIKDQVFSCLYCKATFSWKGYGYSHKFCNNKCQGKYREKNWFEDNKEKFEDGTLSSRAAFKRFVKIRDGNKCSLCDQLPNHNGMPLIMILDHIDGDASNNKPANFRLVCPNCDTQLPTYKSRNYGNDRKTKGLKWYSRI